MQKPTPSQLLNCAAWNEEEAARHQFNQSSQFMSDEAKAHAARAERRCLGQAASLRQQAAVINQ